MNRIYFANWPYSAEEEKADLSRNAIKRSINLALSYRGQMALKNVGLLKEVMKHTVPMRCRAIHSLGAQGEADNLQPVRLLFL